MMGLYTWKVTYRVAMKPLESHITLVDYIHADDATEAIKIAKAIAESKGWILKAVEKVTK